MGSFMDKVYSIMGVDVGDTYEEEQIYEDYTRDSYEEPDPNEGYMPSRRSSSRSNSRVNRFGDAPQMKLVIMQPISFEESRDIANHLKERKPIVVNLESVDNATSRRIVDFLSGAVYALDGDIKKVSNGIFLIVPCNVGVMDDESAYSDNWE
ncbi:MAG TPA: cell division protein SepF [Candidatus Monoglobus merdigallinarum]|uniref:Cell division protein SepF n=1 Tax=Candidatus Monoglobus merdigallinarum TaxID=2838698 RepID=A0A9D1PPB4_9FIRM|nr:cell division protein SepF [Candidatus Monoglobus merdigallinarum]